MISSEMARDRGRMRSFVKPRKIEADRVGPHRARIRGFHQRHHSGRVIPPERKAPTGTSAIMRRLTASRSKASRLVYNFIVVSLQRIGETRLRDGPCIPKAFDLGFAASRQRENGAGLKLVHAFVNCVRCRNAIMPHEYGYRSAINARVHPGWARNALSSDQKEKARRILPKREA